VTSEDTLRGLHDEMDRCKKCAEAGYWIIPKAIYSGTRSARVMTIGQAPGVTEVEAGRPFNAGSGTRLFQWLEEAGFEETRFRKEQYMTSVTKCYPGRAKSGSGDRVPTREEQNLCLPYLWREIETVDPELIIPIGRLAINLFYARREPLTAIIGDQKRVDGRLLIPLPHPSGASRWHQTEENRRRIQQAVDLIRAWRELHST